jgi:hypothetical protein
MISAAIIPAIAAQINILIIISRCFPLAGRAWLRVLRYCLKFTVKCERTDETCTLFKETDIYFILIRRHKSLHAAGKKTGMVTIQADFIFFLSRKK